MSSPRVHGRGGDERFAISMSFLTHFFEHPTQGVSMWTFERKVHGNFGIGDEILPLDVVDQASAKFGSSLVPFIETNLSYVRFRVGHGAGSRCMFFLLTDDVDRVH